MAFLGVAVPHAVARSLAALDVIGDKVDSGSYHITLLYLGEETPIDQISKALVATYDVTSTFKPFHVDLNILSCFPLTDEATSCPIMLKIECEQLTAIQKKLKKSFDKHGVEYSKKFKSYNPHITLSYSDKEIKTVDIENIELPVQELVLWAGSNADDRLSVNFPLKCPSIKQSNLLLNKSSNFEKICKIK